MTKWTVIAGMRPNPDSPQAKETLAELCGAYWYPLYAFARGCGLGVEDAQDATQSFFARIVKDNLFAAAMPEKGLLRTFLRTSFRNHMADERARGLTAKRGGGVVPVRLDFARGERRFLSEPADTMTPEKAYDRNWAEAMMLAARRSLSRHEERAGRGAQYCDSRGVPFRGGG